MPTVRSESCDAVDAMVKRSVVVNFSASRFEVREKLGKQQDKTKQNKTSNNDDNIRVNGGIVCHTTFCILVVAYLTRNLC